MRYYIISKNLCQVKLNGNLIGVSDCSLQLFNANEGDLLELYPLKSELAPIFITLNNRAVRNSELTVYEYNGGFILLPFFPLKPIFNYKPLFNEELESVSACIFTDGQVKLFINGKNGSNLFYLPLLPTKATAKEQGGLLFLTVENRAQKICFVFDVNSLPTLKLTYPIRDIIFNASSFTLIRKVNLIRSSILSCEYGYDLTILNKNFIKSRAISSLSPLLIPFAFLEELLENMQIEEFLDSSLQPHKQMILQYFGNFSTFIPFIKEDQSRAILLYDKQVKEACFCLENRLIKDFFFT